MTYVETCCPHLTLNTKPTPQEANVWAPGPIEVSGFMAQDLGFSRINSTIWARKEGCAPRQVGFGGHVSEYVSRVCCGSFSGKLILVCVPVSGMFRGLFRPTELPLPDTPGHPQN